jgi:hypothetical protein
MTYVTARDGDGRLHQVVLFESVNMDEMGLGCEVCGPQFDQDEGKCEYLLDAERQGPF